MICPDCELTNKALQKLEKFKKLHETLQQKIKLATNALKKNRNQKKTQNQLRKRKKKTKQKKPKKSLVTERNRAYTPMNHGLMMTYREGNGINYIATSGLNNCIAFIMYGELENGNKRGLLVHFSYPYQDSPGKSTEKQNKFSEEKKRFKNEMNGYLTHLYQKFTEKEKFNGNISIQLALPKDKNKSLLESLQTKIKILTDNNPQLESKLDFEPGKENMACALDLRTGKIISYKEQIMGITKKSSKRSWVHPTKEKGYYFVRLENNTYTQITLPKTKELGEEQILKISCICGVSKKANEIIQNNPTLINQQGEDLVPPLCSIFKIRSKIDEETRLSEFVEESSYDILCKQKDNILAKGGEKLGVTLKKEFSERQAERFKIAGVILNQ